MKGMCGTANSMDWDHSVDTAQSPQGKHMFFFSDSWFNKTEEALWPSG